MKTIKVHRTNHGQERNSKGNLQLAFVHNGVPDTRHLEGRVGKNVTPALERRARLTARVSELEEEIERLESEFEESAGGMTLNGALATLILDERIKELGEVRKALIDVPKFVEYEF